MVVSSCVDGPGQALAERAELLDDVRAVHRADGTGARAKRNAAKLPGQAHGIVDFDTLPPLRINAAVDYA